MLNLVLLKYKKRNKELIFISSIYQQTKKFENITKGKKKKGKQEKFVFLDRKKKVLLRMEEADCRRIRHPHVIIK